MHASLVFELKYGNLPGHNNLTTSQANITAVQETTETNTIILIYINMLSVSDVLTDSVTKIKTGTKYFVFMNGTC